MSLFKNSPWGRVTWDSKFEIIPNQQRATGYKVKNADEILPGMIVEHDGAGYLIPCQGLATSRNVIGVVLPPDSMDRDAYFPKDAVPEILVDGKVILRVEDATVGTIYASDALMVGAGGRVKLLDLADPNILNISYGPRIHSAVEQDVTQLTDKLLQCYFRR